MKTGCIGLGAMGLPIAVNFHRAGVLHRVWNRSRSKAEECARQTAVVIAESPAALARECELIVLCVARDADVRMMIDALSTAVAEDTVVVDVSTVSMQTAQYAAEKLALRATHFLDCPVSGGVEGAQKGSLAMMAGGDVAILERCRPDLQAIAGNIQHIGDVGSGQAAKAVNQIMAAGINQAVTEALAFGVAMELDMAAVIDVIKTGAAGNWFLQHRGKSMLAGDYTPGFKLSLHHKDLEICQQMLRCLGENSLPLVEMSLIHYQRLIAAGYGEEDISALFRLKRELLQEQ